MTQPSSQRIRPAHNLALALLICAAFLAPIIGLSAWLANTQYRHIASERAEMHGQEHGAALRLMLRHVLAWQTLQISTPGGPAAAQAQAQDAWKAVQNAFAAADRLAAREDASWHGADGWRSIGAHIKRFDLMAVGTPQDAGGHEELTQAILRQLRRVAVETKLVIDAELEISSLSLALNALLPDLAVNLTQLSLLGADIASATAVDPAKAERISHVGELASQRWARLKDLMAIALTADADARAALDRPLALTAEALSRTLQSINAVFQGGRKPAITAEIWRTRVALVLDDLYRLDASIAKSRTERLERHIHALTREFWLALGAIGGMILLGTLAAALLGRRLLASIRQREADLEAINAARRQALAESTRAERASGEKTRFLATLSHEIRTPLSAMIGFSDLLLGCDLAPEQASWAKRVADNADMLSLLLNDMLDLARIEAGTLALNEAPASPLAVVEQCASSFRVLAARKGVGFETDLQNLPELARFDALRVRQILFNFLSNAIKFTSHGHVKLIARLQGQRLRFEVGDTGVGMDSEARARLFTAQAVDVAAPGVQSAGIGLHICARLAEAMGATLGMHSALGVGSVFWLELPERAMAPQPTDAAPNTAADEALVKMPGEAQARPAADAGAMRFDPPLRVLVVDDVEANRLLVQGIAGAMGCSVATAADGIDAVQIAQDQQFDLILMDLHMPRMDGIDATRRIRTAAGPNQGTAIIALTASAYEADAERCIAVGMNAHVAKPVRAAALRAVIGHWGAVARGGALWRRTPTSAAAFGAG